jgi:flagellar hook assembly protein FlgD
MVTSRHGVSPKEIEMKTKTIGLSLLLSLMAGAMCFANPTMGKWKLNESKSTFGEGSGKSTMVVWEKAGHQDKCTVDGTDAHGQKTHTVWTGKLDGKDYPITGDATSDTRSFKMNGENTIDMVSKKDGKAIGDGTIVVATDGKTRTVTSTMTNDKGVKVTSTLAYDKS